MTRNRGGRSRRHISVAHLLLALCAIPCLLPLVWMVTVSFTPAPQIYAQPFRWLPNPVTLENFAKGWALLDFPRFYANSLLVTSLTVVGTVFSSAVVGYAFALLPARGSGLLFAVLLAMLVLPPTVTLVPQFVLFSRLNWINTYLPLLVPAFLGNGFFIFLCRQYFLGLPRELFESAEIDGCTPWKSFRAIALPLAHPVLATVAILTYIGSWNDFLGPLVYLSTTSKFTVSLGLALFHGLFYTQIQYLIPMALVGLAPSLLFFALAQRAIVPTLTAAGNR